MLMPKFNPGDRISVLLMNDTLRNAKRVRWVDKEVCETFDLVFLLDYTAPSGERLAIAGPNLEAVCAFAEYFETEGAIYGDSCAAE